MYRPRGSVINRRVGSRHCRQCTNDWAASPRSTMPHSHNPIRQKYAGVLRGRVRGGTVLIEGLT